MPWIGGAIAAGGSLVGGLLGADAASTAAGQQADATNAAIGAQRAAAAQARADLSPYRLAGNQALDRLTQLIGINPSSGWKNTMLPNGKNAWQEAEDRANNDLVPAGNVPIGYYKDKDSQLYNDTINKYLPGVQSAYGISGPTANGDDGSLLRSFNSNDLANDPIYKNALDFSNSEGEKAINARAAAGGGFDSGATLKALSRFNQGNASSLGNDAFNRFQTGQNNQFNRLNSLVGTGQNAAAGTGSAAMSTGNNISGLLSGQGNAAGAATIAGGNALSNGFAGAANGYNNYNLLSQLTGAGQRGGGSTPGGYNMTDINNMFG